jgi:hypothetical protein
MGTEPVGEFLLAEFALGKMKKLEIDLFFRGHDVPAIPIKESD